LLYGSGNLVVALRVSGNRQIDGLVEIKIDDFELDLRIAVL
jgi:hypothetical protein